MGCPSITPPVSGWIKQTGHNAYIGCENIPTTWRLYCNGTSWVGERGNCTVTGKLKMDEFIVNVLKISLLFKVHVFKSGIITIETFIHELNTIVVKCHVIRVRLQNV